MGNTAIFATDEIMVDGDLATIIEPTGCYPCDLLGIFLGLLISPPTFFILANWLVSLTPEEADQIEG